jgi:hypothetical protein
LWQFGNSGYQRRQFIQQAAGLAGFVININLQADIQGRQGSVALVVQAVGYFQALHTVHPAKRRRYLCGFIGLNRPYKMPS